MKTETVIERNAHQDTVKSLKELALKHVAAIKELDTKIKESNSMINEVLMDNEAYASVDAEAKDIAKKKSQIKEQVMSTPEMAPLAGELKDLREEKKSKQESLSEYLIEYERLSGKNVIETPKGEQLSIFKSAKVVRI